MPRLLELFSGTGSFGKIANELNWTVTSLDRDLQSDIKEDIMAWDYTIYTVDSFDIITASPVCLWWSALRKTNIGRKLKMLNGNVLTSKMIDDDIEKFGKPMVDRVREIINYFKPKYWLIENPQSGTMKSYITDLPYTDVDYCQYSDWGYRKRTRLWTNINFTGKLCNKKTCKSVKDGKHIIQMGCKNSTTQKERYRIPSQLIRELFNTCEF